MNIKDTLEICSNLNNILEQYGNINFITKEELYMLVDYIRNHFKVTTSGEAFNIIKFYEKNFSEILNYQLHAFNDKKIGGFLVKNQYPEKSHIVINSSKDGLSALFDLAHELMHFLLHPEDRQYYISTSLCNIDNFEWQANEGAAELLVPYKKFIPKFSKYIKNCRNYNQYIDLIKRLSEEFVVSTAVIEYRISGLKYEINQYENGISLDNLKFLSQRAQEENGIYIQSYNNIFKNRKSNLKSILENFSFSKTQSNALKTEQKLLDKKNENPELLIRNWQEVLGHFKSNGRIILYTNLIDTKILQIDDNTVAIKFSKDITEFGKVVLSKESNQKLIEEQINLLFKKKLNIQYVNKLNQIINLQLDDAS